MFTKYDSMGSRSNEGEAACFYDAGQVDARIAELEGALKSAALVISKQLEQAVIHSHIAREALSEADRVLSITS